MSGTERPLNPFSEEAALAELERTRRELEESRQRRRQANEAFDSFIRSFRQRPPETHAVPLESVTEPAPLEAAPFPPAPSYAPILPAAAEPLAPPIIDESFASAIETEHAAAVVAPTDEPPAIPTVPVALRTGVSRPRSGRGVRIGAGVATLVAFAGFLAWRARTPDPAQESPAVRNPPVVQSPPPPSAEPAPTPAASGLEAELVTLRAVWVRVIADGERRIERELAAGQKIPVSARETIVVRAGDAGALRVVIAGKDQGPFGQDGFPATRTFTRAQAK